MLVNNNRILKIIASICLTGLVVAALTAWNNPAIGYELDIYASTPIVTWMLIIFAILGGVSIIVHQIITKDYAESNIWLIGLLILIFARLVLLYVPYVRNYVTWDGDNISHVGLLKDIILTGHFASNNYYPVTHSILSQTVIITGIDEITVANLSTTIISIMYVLSTYLLTTAVLPSKDQRLLATLFAGAVVLQGGYNVLLMPNGWSILLMPLMFYCYFKASEDAFRILFLMFLVAYPFFHPLSSLMTIGFLVVIMLSWWLFRMVMKQRGQNIAKQPQFSLQLVLIECVILFPWLLFFLAFRPNLRMLWEQITSGITPDILRGMQLTLGKVSTGLIDSLIIFLKLYGVNAGVIVLSLLGLVLLVRQILRGDIRKETFNLVNLFVVFLFAGFLYFLYLLGAPGLGAIGAQRLLSYTTIFTPVLASVPLYGLLDKTKLRFLAGTGIICLTLALSFLSIRGLYYSPFVVQPNLQITYKNMAGMTWLFEEKDKAAGFVFLMSPPERYADGILGTEESSKRTDISRNVLQFSDHFGYASYGTLGEQYPVDKYTGITKHDRIIYSTVWQAVGRFNDTDFERLDGDSTVDKLYSNSELDVYYIHGVAAS